MPVAKSYENSQILNEPYAIKGRKYVTILYKGHEKQVRWYSDAEYAKMYGVTPDHTKDPFYKTQKEVLGFKNGYIWIFTGPTYENKEWFKEKGCHFTRWWGWGWSSEMEDPKEEELPEGIEMKKLPWEVVGIGDTLIPEDKIAAALDFILYEPGKSEFIHEIGDKVNLKLIVRKNITLDGYYGISHMHIMEDESENVWVWTTQAKDWEEGSIHEITGTIKDQRVYKNVKQNILTRCREK
jgi:hypothetical protein